MVPEGGCEDVTIALAILGFGIVGRGGIGSRREGTKSKHEACAADFRYAWVVLTFLLRWK